MSNSGQNTSHAVMAQRVEDKDSYDYFPTPPWATRALIKYVLEPIVWDRELLTCLEPACGQGHMVRPLQEFFGTVNGSDIQDFGQDVVYDFLDDWTTPRGSYDWMITNPPFNRAEEFIDKGLEVARQGVAIIARTTFLESKGRYERLFKRNPPTFFAQFVERVPMYKGRLVKGGTTATGYAWFVWDHAVHSVEGTKVLWIPPCRKELEKDSDYDEV
jgi:hypothetical protein